MQTIKMQAMQTLGTCLLICQGISARRQRTSRDLFGLASRASEWEVHKEHRIRARPKEAQH